MLKRFEMWMTVLMLLFLSNGVVWIVVGGDSETSFVRTQSTLPLHIMQVLLYGVAFSFALLHWKKVVAGAIAGRWVLILSLAAVVSVVWSADPNATAMHGLALLATTGFGIYIGSRYTLREQVGLLLRTFSLVILLSVAFSLLLPRYGVDHYFHLGDWQGIFEQKNLLGKAMVVAIIVFLSARGRMPGLVRWLAISSGIALLVLSRSKTALLLIPVFMVLGYAYRLLRMKKTFSIPVIIGMAMGSAIAVAFAILNSEEILILLHRDPTLTGRTSLWQAVWDKISTHMALGYGFDAFWNGLQGPSANVILTLGWSAKHSHNGFLDILLDLGVLGLGLFLVSYFVALRRAIRLAAHSSRSEVCWPLHYLVFMILYYTTEGQLMRQDSLYWALYVAVAVAVASVPVPAEETQREVKYPRTESAMAVPSFAAAQSWGSPNV